MLSSNKLSDHDECLQFCNHLEILPVWSKRYIQGRMNVCIQFISVKRVKEMITLCTLPLQEKAKKTDPVSGGREQRLFQSLHTIDGKLFIVHLQLAPNASSKESMSWKSSARLLQRTAPEY